MTSRRGRAVLGALVASGLAACGTDSAPSDRGAAGAGAPMADAGPDIDGDWFVDRAEASGLDFVHVNGMTGRFYQPEMMGPGAALFDYDNDGDLDVYLVQGGPLGDGAPILPPPAGQPPGDRLFRNDLAPAAQAASGSGAAPGSGPAPGANAAATPVPAASPAPDADRAPGPSPAPAAAASGPSTAPAAGAAPGPAAAASTLRFTDVTDEAGIAARGYGMGVAAGDIDNDGWIDLYLTRFGPNQLLRNLGDGTFADVPAAGGAADASLSIAAAFFDYDRDGRLDLFLGNYLNYTLETHWQCYAQSGPPDYCPPEVSPPLPDRLFRNAGGGRFVDVTEAAGLGRDYGPALGAAAADYDNDGWLDLFVANDQQENQLWMNQRDGTFRNGALLRGTALGAGGVAKADMGVDAGDFDNDGDEDLFITELAGQGSTLYVNDGAGVFQDRSAALGIRAASLPYTGFGAGWIDLDNDGWLDVIAVNGTVTLNLDTYGPDNPFALQQRNQVFRNRGGAGFEDVTGRAGAAFSLAEVSRGAAFGDLDNDGDTDVVIANGAGRVRLLVNEVGHRRRWVGLRLVGGDPPRDLVGARVAVTRADGLTVHRRARADGSYASAHDPRVLVGLGGADGPVRVRVTWPDGQVETWTDVPIDRYTTLTRGEGASSRGGRQP